MDRLARTTVKEPLDDLAASVLRVANITLCRSQSAIEHFDIEPPHTRFRDTPTSRMEEISLTPAMSRGPDGFQIEDLEQRLYRGGQSPLPLTDPPVGTDLQEWIDLSWTKNRPSPYADCSLTARRPPASSQRAAAAPGRAASACATRARWSARAQAVRMAGSKALRAWPPSAPQSRVAASRPPQGRPSARVSTGS
jgi:hypothetical protein